jgi:hypothetical protein
MSDLESIDELVRLYRGGSSDYTPEYLAAAICREIGRQRRLKVANARENLDSGLAPAERLLAHDAALAERALSATIGPEVLEEFREYTRERSLGDEGDEGFRLLFTYDSLHLLASSVRSCSKSLGRAGRTKLKELEGALRGMERLIAANLAVFQPDSNLVNDYCLRWGVDEESPLSRVAELSEAEGERLLQSRSEHVVPLGGETPDCLSLNVVAAMAEGSPTRPEWTAHLKACPRCVQILNDTINVTLRTRVPLEERVARLSKTASAAALVVRGEALRGSSAVTGALREWAERLPPLPAVPTALAASTKRSRTVRVSTVDASGQRSRRSRAAVVRGPVISKGVFTLDLRLPGALRRGCRIWVSLKLSRDQVYLGRARTQGERVALRAKGFPPVSASLPLSRIEVVIVEPRRT